MVRQVQVVMEAAMAHRLQVVVASVALELRSTIRNSSDEEASTLGCWSSLQLSVECPQFGGNGL